MKSINTKSGQGQLTLMKDKTINMIYIIFGILAIPLVITSIARATMTGWRWMYLYHIVIATIPLVVIFLLQRIPYKIKVYLALSILVSDVIIGLLSFGILDNAKVFIILIIVMAGLLLGKRQGYYAIVLSTLILMIMTWLYSNQDLVYSFDVEQYVIKRSVWISMSLFLVGISLFLFEIISRLFKAQTEFSQKVEKSEKRFQTIIQQAADAVYLSNMQGRIVEVNQQACQQTGYTREELLQKTVMELDSSYPTLESAMELWNGMQKERSVKTEGGHVKKDGSTFPVEINISTIELDNGKHILGFARDISDRKKAEEALIASEEKFRNIFNSSSDGIVVTDFDQNILAANQIMLDYSGMNEKQIRSKKVYDFISKKYMPDIQKRMQQLKKGDTVTSFELEIYLNEDLTIPFEINSKVIVFENKPAIMAIMRDISERRQMQQKIMQTIIRTEETERSRFAKELHDGLGPLLSTMNIYMGILSDTTDKKRFETAVNRIQNSVDDAIQSIQQISNNLSPHILQNFGLPEAIRNFFTRLKDIKNIEFNFKSNLDKRLDQNIELALYRVIVELINNSVKYSGAGLIGITIQKKSNMLKVDYSDNGKGFDVGKTIQDTRSMGLHNIYNRINSMNGKVELTSLPGKGMKAQIGLNINP